MRQFYASRFHLTSTSQARSSPRLGLRSSASAPAAVRCSGIRAEKRQHGLALAQIDVGLLTHETRVPAKSRPLVLRRFAVGQ